MIDSLEPRASDRNKQLLYKIAALMEGGAIGSGTDPDVIFGLRPGGDFSGATFTGNSLATYIAQDGLVRFAPHNYALWSTDPTNPLFQGAGVSFAASSVVGIEGETMFAAHETVDDTVHRIVQYNVLEAGATYTTRVYAKAGAMSWIMLADIGPNAAYFNLATGAVGTVAGAGTIAQINPTGIAGVYECILTWIPPIDAGYFSFAFCHADNAPTHAGNPAVAAGYIQRGQLERNRTASNYVPTGATAILRTPRNAHYVQGNRTLLLEGARTNSCFPSNNLADAAWIKFQNGDGAVPTVSTGYAAPDGSPETASLIQINRATNTSYSGVYQATSVTGVATGSIWVKAEGPNVGKTINVGVFTSPYTVTLVTLTANWQRVSVTGTMAYPSQLYIGYIAVADLGTAGTGFVEFLAWGAQVELGPSASSLIYTTTAAVTRVADVLSFPYTAPPQEMTMFVRAHRTGSCGVLDTPIQINGAPYISNLWIYAFPGSQAILRLTDGSDLPESATPINLPTDSLCELRGVLTQGGAVQLAVSINGGIEGVGPLTAAVGLPVNWGTTPILFAGTDPNGSYPGFFAIRDIIIAKGVKDLAYFRALIAP